MKLYRNKSKIDLRTKSVILTSLLFSLFLLLFIQHSGSSNQINASASNSQAKNLNSTRPNSGGIGSLQVAENDEMLKIPVCQNTQPLFGGIEAFRCETDLDQVIHYEYFENSKILDSINTTFGLTKEITNPQRAVRTGIIDGKSRLLATDKDLKLAVNIVTDSDESILVEWWAKYAPQDLYSPQNTGLNENISSNS